MIPKAFWNRGRRPALIPHGRRVYAIGDVHGRADLLDILLPMIDDDDTARGAAETTIVFLGDLIDRGPDSAAVVERSRQLARTPLDVRFLMGNHEEVLLDILNGAPLALLRLFRRIGGDATIISYGMSKADVGTASNREILDFLMEAVPGAHVSFLSGFLDQVVVGDYAFVHAGVRPNVPLAKQRAGDLRWIRDEFLAWTKPFEKTIVHGHTITGGIDERPNRIGLDTGAYASGCLSAMGFEDAERWPIQAFGMARGAVPRHRQEVS